MDHVLADACALLSVGFWCVTTDICVTKASFALYVMRKHAAPTGYRKLMGDLLGALIFMVTLCTTFSALIMFRDWTTLAPAILIVLLYFWRATRHRIPE